MPYRPNSREYWLTVGGGKCQWENYTEDGGFKECGKTARHVHHIITEAEQLEQGLNPEQSVGMGLCEDHHTRNYGQEIFDRNSSMHGESMAWRYDAYRVWKPTAKHMAEINNRSIDYSDSPFSTIGQDHREMRARGERVCAGDTATDNYLLEKMRTKATTYNAENGVQRPCMKPHPEFTPENKVFWYTDIVNQFDNTPPIDPDTQTMIKLDV